MDEKQTLTGGDVGSLKDVLSGGDKAPPTPPAPKVNEPAAEAEQPYLVTRHCDLGPRGTWLDMTATDAKPHLEAEDLKVPTADQLALRVTD